ncbi:MULTISPECIES: hypothetical protein [Streptomyces]|uniref:hypothetical protein n=1 Tax=Streptomyces TaxID=1883 RepID=UPI00017E9DCB|nr:MULTISPECIES: hypothetical protein [Streptomyces]AKL68877.1 hypothetical protein M444_29475 [Streptomyces sp. Mg1]EDX23355.1 hypothetical protein SSAG_03146 [Streptomyces sp. Mg1]RPK34965.1 hypothetical protein EES37_29585 [Streptomyces sp. ADI91-18]WBY23147.1 hypothetical protein PET44_27995 [Streptomyces goshikiensis]WSS01971.1 hypothetical protein OG224_30170 [Streptomyces goshikiensis]
MGAIRSSATALLSAGATGAALALGALGMPSATAAEAQPAVTSFGFTVTPSTVAPGGQAVLSVSGCNAAYATASSGIFDTVSIARGQTARVTVDRDARRGAVYSVSFTCNGETGSADVTIAGGTTRPTTSSTAGVSRNSAAPVPRNSAAPVPRGSVPAAPVPAGSAPAPSVPAPSGSGALGVRGGLGGSVAGMDPLELGAGAAFFLAAAAGTAYVVRRRGTGRSH